MCVTVKTVNADRNSMKPMSEIFTCDPIFFVDFLLKKPNIHLLVKLNTSTRKLTSVFCFCLCM